MEDRSDKGHRADAGQFFVAGELCRRGYVAVVTMGNCPNTDILCSNAKGTRFVHIQVKTFRPGNRTCTVGRKAETDYGKGFVWVLAGVPPPDSTEPFCFYMVPSGAMARNVKKCFELFVNTPGAKGQPHNPETKIRTVHLPPRKNRNGWTLKPYLNRWDIIERILGATLPAAQRPHRPAARR